MRLFFFILSITSSLFAQPVMDSLRQYHPLQHNDTWLYKRSSGAFPAEYRNAYFSFTVAGDTVIGNKQYRVVIEYDLEQQSAKKTVARFDTVNGNFYYGVPDLSGESQNDFTLEDSTAANIVNTSFKVGKLVSLQQDTVLGLRTDSRDIIRLMMIDTGVRKRFARGLGLVREEHSGMESFYDSLIYAKIGGKEYGRITSKRMLDSLTAFYPLQKGNIWVYRRATSDYYDKVTIPGDTLMDNKKYYSIRLFETFKFPADTAHYRSISYVRIDTAYGRIFQYSHNYDPDSERLIDSLLSNVGDTIKTGWRHPINRGRGSAVIFGAERVFREIKLRGQPIEDFLQYSWGIGLSRTVDSMYFDEYPFNLLSASYTSLVYAKLNGKEYGNDPLAVHTASVRMPAAFSLEQNYPNPFNPITTITYRIPERTFVSMTIFSPLGTSVAVPVSSVHNAGEYSIQYDASALSSGVYFYRLTAGTFTKTEKMILLK